MRIKKKIISETVEEVESLIVERIANMKIEDQVQQMITTAVNNLNLDPKIKQIAQAEAGKLDAILTVNIDDLNGAITNLRTQTLASINDLNNQVQILRLAVNQNSDLMASSTALNENIKIDEKGNIVIGANPLYQGGTEAGGEVQIMDITEITASSTQTAFVVNQQGTGAVADFQAAGVSIMNIADSGEVKIMGSLLVDGRVMLCTGGNCSNTLDNAVDATQADLGVEGKVVAGAFEGYCADGYIWVPGSAEYGTLPGFCVMSDLMQTAPDIATTNVSQGSAQVACQTLGAGYHLLGENEWLTIAENILQVAANDTDAVAAGMQLATTTSATSTALKLTNDNVINNLTGGVAEWTKGLINQSDLPVLASGDWQEYGNVSSYKSLSVIRPPYYLTDANNQIGKIKIGADASEIRGYARGINGIYGLDLSHAPDEKSVEIGFRCAK